MATQIKLRRDTAANWALEDPTLAQGEPGYDTTNKILKIGDGTTIWSLLPSIYDPKTSIVPDADNTYDLGSPDKQWRHVYTAGGSIYLDNIKLTNVAGKFVAKTVINPGTEEEEDDPEDSDATSEISGGGSGGVVEREINFPQGEEGDTAGTLALTPWGGLYVCTADWEESQGFEVETAELFATGQTGGIVTFVIAQSEYSDVSDLVNIDNPGEWTVTADLELAGQGTWTVTTIEVNTLTQGEFQGEQGWWFKVGSLGLNYPTQIEEIPAGTTFELTYNPAIWKEVSTGSSLGDLTVENGNEITNENGELVLSVTGGGGDIVLTTIDGGDDILLTADDDIRITANEDIRLRTYNSNVNIITNYDAGASEHVWDFDVSGNLTLPAGGDILDSNGNSVLGGGSVDSNIWVQTFETATPATDVPQVVTSVEYDSDGNIIALFIHTNPVNDSTYYSVGKYTTTGTRIWTTRFADDFFTDGWGLAVDNDGGFVYIAGRTSADGGQDNATLTKISGTTGLVEWSKKYDFGYNSSSAVVDVNAEGDPVMVGFAEGEVDRYVTTTKIDQTDGSIIWSRALDGQGDEQAYGMAVGPSSEVVAVGYMSQLGDSSDTEDHMVVVKYNSAGVIQWQRAILFDEGYDSTGADADIDSEGNIYVCGQYETDIGGPVSQLMSIIKFNSMGVKQWSRRIVGNCGAFTSSIVVGADDHLYLSATTFAGTEFSVTDIHLVLAKYSFDGLVEWQRLLDYTPGYSFGAFFFGAEVGGSNLAVKQDYVAVGLGFGSEEIFGPGSINAAVAQIPASGNVFTVGNWDFKAASFSGTVNSTASDITVANADKTDYDNISGIDTATVTLEEDSSNFLIGTLFTAPGSGDSELVNGEHVFALESDGTLTLDGEPFNGNGFLILADGTLQANVEGNATTLTSATLTSKPTWLSITPRSPDRNTLDTHYGFDSTGMWFAGDTEETFDDAPAYPIHTTDSFPADVKVVVEFEIDYNDGQEDWGICVYPADGIPHWSWDPHPSRIAATIDIGDNDLQIYGFTTETFRSLGNPNPGTYTARFTYDPIAELSTFEIEDSAGVVFSRCQLPGRLARDQDYRIGFDADWDDAEGPTEKSYFTGLTITSGNTTDAKATELTVTGEIKLPNTTKGFVNIQGPWNNGDDDLHFQTVVAHDGFAYMGGETNWNDNNTIRLDKYSLTTGELVWTRVLGAGRNAEFNISWTGGVYTIDSIANSGEGYKTGDLLYIAGDALSGNDFLNRATITVTDVNNQGEIQTATIAGTAPDGAASSPNAMETNNDGNSDPMSIKYDTVSDTVVMLNHQYTITGDADDLYQDRAVIVRVNPVSGDVVSTVTLSDEGDIRPYDVAIHPTTGATAVVGEKYNEYRQFGTLTMANKGIGYFDILKSELDPEHYPGSNIPGEYPSDYWISGTGITGKENVDNANYYEGLSGTTRQGSGTVTVELIEPSAIPFSLQDFTDTTLIDGNNITKNSDNFVTPGSFGGVWLTIATGALATSITSAYTNGSIIPVTWTAGSTTTSGYALVYFNMDGTIQFTSVDSGGNAVAGTWYFPANLAGGSGPTVTVTAGGTNYRTGHKIKYLGTELPGGATPANDIILTVTAVDGSGTITTATAQGTMPGGDVTDLSAGTNIDVGSGLTLNIEVDSVTGSRIANVNTGGSNYVAGDVVYISGSEFANGSNGWEILSATTSGYNGAEAYFSKSTYPTLDTTLLAVTVGSIAKFDNGATARVNVIRTADPSNWGVTFTGTIPASITGPISFFANDVEVTIVEIGQAGGNVTSAVTAGSTPTNMIRVFVNGVDFTVPDGAWTMKQDLGGEAFVWTADWNKAIGAASSNDRFHSVVYSKDGASIYAVGQGRYEVEYDQSLVVKYATSDGTIGFSKYLNSATENSRAYGVATIGTSDIVVSGYEYIGTTDRDTQFVARMTSSGTVVWKKLLINTWPSGIDNPNDIQVDSDDNIYVTMSYQADTPNFTNTGFHVTKLDQAGNVVWSRCVNAPNTGSYLGYGNGNRWSSLHNDQLVVAGHTYNTGDMNSSGLWVSFPTDGFTYLGGEGDFVQMGAWRFSQGSIYVTEDLIPGASSFTPSVQAPTITATNNLKNYATREPIDLFEQHLHKMVDPKHGGVVFGDGSRQTFATDIMPQIKADRGYTITAQDSGKHIYYKNNSGTITIPAEDGGIVLPVGFTFTIINRTGGDCFVRLYNTGGPTTGTILGSNRNTSYFAWGIPDTGSGSMVTLIKLESLHVGNPGAGTNIQEPVWMISGPDSIYPDN